MRGYFAKLAARATLGDSPTPTPWANRAHIHDPFEATEVAPDAATSPAVPTSGPLENSGTALDRQTARPRESVKPLITIQKKESALHPFAQPVAITTPASAVPPTESSQPAKNVAPESTPRHEKLTPPVQPPMPAASLPATRDVKELDSVSSEEDRDETRLEEIQQEQRQLLRKADLFMERLFNARSASDEERRRELPALTPPLQTRRRIEPDRAPPSLVIGKLTVEVTPPAPPATAPAQQQVVVVREGDGSRSSFHSSRRFGLSQF